MNAWIRAWGSWTGAPGGALSTACGSSPAGAEPEYFDLLAASRGLHGREQQGNRHRENPDDHQQLNQGERCDEASET